MFHRRLILSAIPAGARGPPTEAAWLKRLHPWFELTAAVAARSPPAGTARQTHHLDTIMSSAHSKRFNGPLDVGRRYPTFPVAHRVRPRPRLNNGQGEVAVRIADGFRSGA
ncbi:hypothetical protein GCM10027168_30510 [Streptomyces capparidis]